MTTFREDLPFAELNHTEPTRDKVLINWFTHHPPKSDTEVAVYQHIRSAGREMAEVIADECPPGLERDTALDKIREAVMWANASIACSSPSSTD